MSNKKPEPANLQTQLKQLDDLLTWFERDDFDVEAALAKYDEGMKLVSAIEDRLQLVENKVEVLKKRFDQGT